MALAQTLDRLLTVMGTVDESLPEELAPGLDPTEIHAQLLKIRFDPPDELIELYSWRNGGMLVEIVPGSYFAPLELATSSFKYNPIIKAFGFPHSDALRILTDHSDGGFSVKPKKKSGAIVMNCIHAPAEVVLPTIESLFELGAACYESGIFVKQGDEIEPNWDRYEVLENEFFERYA